MGTEKQFLSGNTTMLILKLLEEKDMYGYQIIEKLSQQSENLFQLKTGTLYPILHGLENDAMLTSYEEIAEGSRVRKYYKITKKGKGLLAKKRSEWTEYQTAVGRIMNGGESYAFI